MILSLKTCKYLIFTNNILFSYIFKNIIYIVYSYKLINIFIMKKNKLNGLLLNKKVISNLNSNGVRGGSTIVLCAIIIASAIACTRGADCDLPTIGSGDGSNCISTDGEGWCGGRG